MGNNMEVIVDGKTLTIRDLYGEDVFEIVDEVPIGYRIWNIGDNMAPGYVPFCRLKRIQPFEGGRDIETETMKAIKCEGAKEIMSAASLGFCTLDSMEAFVKRYRNSKSKVLQNQISRCNKALPFMRKLKWR